MSDKDKIVQHGFTGDKKAGGRPEWAVSEEVYERFKRASASEKIVMLYSSTNQREGLRRRYQKENGVSYKVWSDFMNDTMSQAMRDQADIYFKNPDPD